MNIQYEYPSFKKKTGRLWNSRVHPVEYLFYVAGLGPNKPHPDGFVLIGQNMKLKGDG